MLKAVTFKNFKSYREAKLPFSPLTVLIGANASGKSNAIEGLRFLSWLAQGGKLSAIRYASQNGETIVRGDTINLPYKQQDSFGFECQGIGWDRLSITLSCREGELHISDEKLKKIGENLPLYKVHQPSNGKNTDIEIAFNNFSKGGVKPRITCNDQSAIFTQLTSPATFGNYNRSGTIIPDRVSNIIKDFSSIFFLDPIPARMRGYSFPSEEHFQSNGENLSGILFNLWGVLPLVKERGERDAIRLRRQDILEFIKSLPEQNISGMKFLKEPRGGRMLQLMETFGDEKNSYDASVLSDGTLRVLAIVAAMLSAQEGSLVVIEEIDNGVHPSRVKHLVTKIREIAERKDLSVLLSTHNPAFLDALPYEAVPDVVYCYRDPKDGSSQLVKLSNIRDYPELIAQGSLGYLSTSGTLEQFVKNQPTPEEKKAKALAWLNTMFKEDTE